MNICQIRRKTCKILKIPYIDFVSQSQFKGYPQHIRIFMYKNVGSLTKCLYGYEKNKIKINT